MNIEFPDWTTPLVADAAVRNGTPFAVIDQRLFPIDPAMRACGRALPSTHLGSVDAFLDAIDRSAPGDVLAIDNGGRTDEGCIGDLVVAEAAAAGLSGIVCWGKHRDTADIVRIGLPVFSTGTWPAGPRELRAAAAGTVHLGAVPITTSDAIFADQDGVLVLRLADVTVVLEEAERIFRSERAQADLVRSGRSLREQFQFEDYVKRRAKDAAYTFRAHLRRLGAEIEE